WDFVRKDCLLEEKATFVWPSYLCALDRSSGLSVLLDRSHPRNYDHVWDFRDMRREGLHEQNDHRAASSARRRREFARFCPAAPLLESSDGVPSAQGRATSSVQTAEPTGRAAATSVQTAQEL